MKRMLFSIFVLVSLHLAMAARIPKEQQRNHEAPTLEMVKQIQSDFLQLQRPLNYKIHEAPPYSQMSFMGSPAEGPYKIILSGDAKELEDKYHPADILIAVYPFFKDPKYDVDARIVCLGIIKEGVYDRDIKSISNRIDSGQWDQEGKRTFKIDSSVARNYIQGWVKGDERSGEIVEKLKTYRIPPAEILPSSLKKNEENSLVSSATSVATTTPQAAPSQTPTPQGTVEGTKSTPKPIPSAAATKPEPKQQPTPATQTESQKQTWPLWLASVAFVLGAVGIVIRRNRKK